MDIPKKTEQAHIKINQKSPIETHGQPSETVVLKKMNLDAGWLGKIFGGSENAPTNISGMVIGLLIAAGVCTIFVNAKMEPVEYWTKVTPMITLALGYLFGTRHQ